MESARAWVAAARVEDAILAPLCVAVGSSYAHYDAQPGPGLPAHLVVSLGALAAGVGVNLVDHGWTLLQAAEPGPLDGRDAMIGGGAAIVLACICGLGLVPLSGGAALGYGAFAVFLGLARAIPAVGLDALGWGLSEISAFVALGPLAACAGFASQAGTGSWGAVLAGLPAGLVAATPSLARRFTSGAPGTELRKAFTALPLLAAAAVLIAARAREYGPLAYAAAIPMVVMAVAGWRIPASPAEDDSRRWTKLAAGCAIAALVTIVAALRMATSE